MLNKTQKKAVLKRIIKEMKKDPSLDFDEVIQLYEDTVLFLKEVRAAVVLHMTIPEPDD